MANPTTNYGFVLPTSTDLVTDLPADFDVALQGVDTRLKALQPGTTLGDIAYSSATANTNTRLAIGTTGQVLTVASGVPSWAAAAGGTANYALLNAGGTAMSGSASVTVSGISGVKDIFIRILDTSEGANDGWRVRFNSDTAANYYWITQNSVYFAAQTSIKFDQSAARSSNTYLSLAGAGTSPVKPINFSKINDDNTSPEIGMGYYNSSSAISSVTVSTITGNFDAGTIYVYGG
jgi:hypothetical protein